jgi:hypothetical protein
MTALKQFSRFIYRGARRVQAKCMGIYSNFDEQVIIKKYVSELKIQQRLCVDIAAGDGTTMSNTYSLFRSGWNGLAVEYDAKKFARLSRVYQNFTEVCLAKCKVTPPNVVALLKANQLPTDFGFLNLDIDGYDYFVLEQILDTFRPSLICVEINEKIPPPVKFTVKWNPNYSHRGDHFYGQSVSQLYSLCPRFRYSLINLHYNNAFLVPVEINPYPPLTAEQAYQKGYLNQPDRKARFPWNSNMEDLLKLSPEQAVDFLNQFFEAYQGDFICSL